MLDYQRIVDEVRSSLFSNNAEGADFLRMAAADYSVACDELNERLRRCGTLLKKGLRSEAIQLAEIEPNLLDLVATLDFPERQHWVDVLTLNGIVAPRPLMLDVAADLNEAYAVEQPLTELLRQHRLLALSRGPLSLRVYTLRSLSQSDGNNPVWREDLSVFEKERQKELQREVAEAAKGSDLATITALNDELRSEGWLELPPRELVRFTTDVRSRLEGQQSRAELAEAVRSLNDSYAAFDVDIGRQWREHFNSLAAHCGVAPDDELVERATPALAWLTEQDEIAEQQSQHDAAVAELDEALRHNAPARELIRKHNAARANGFALSERLVDAVKDRLAAMERAKTLKRRILIGGISLGVLLIAGLSALIIRNVLLDQEVARQADALGNLLDAGDLKGARTLIDQTSPSVTASDEIQRLGDRLEGAERKEAKRHETFEADLRQAKSASADSPDYDALTEASTLARTAAEKAELKQYKDGIAAAERTAIAAHDAEFNTALVDFQKRLKKLEAGPNDDIPTALAEVAQFRSDFKATETRIPSTSGAVLGQTGPMLTRLDTIEAALRRRQSEESQLELITRAVGDADAYQDALASYVRQFPDSPRSADFKTALDDAPIWLGLKKWNDLLLTFRKLNLGVVDPATATTLLTAGNLILKDYDNYPGAASIHQCLPYLEAISHRVDSQNAPITEALKRLFNDPLMSDVWMIELMIESRKETFYLKQKPELEPDRSVPVNYIAGFDMAEKRVPGGVRGGVPLRNGAAPQTILAGIVRKQLDQLNDENWDRTFFQIVKSILDDHPPVDPILKFNLLKQTLDVGCRGSHVFEKAFKPQLAAMQAASIDPTADWLDPLDKVAQKNRSNAETLFSAFPDINAAGKVAADDLAELRKPTGVLLRWVGWVRRGGTGAWRCNPDRLGSESGDLVVPIKMNGGGATLLHIGKLERGIAEIAAKESSPLAEGRPVYLVLP